jgi:hypothetical protein
LSGDAGSITSASELIVQPTVFDESTKAVHGGLVFPDFALDYHFVIYGTLLRRSLLQAALVVGLFSLA